MSLFFIVCAGTWDQDDEGNLEPNHKYISPALCEHEAYAIHSSMNTYPWAFIEDNVGNLIRGERP